MKTKIPLFSLVLLIVAAIDSIRTLPTTAFFGSSLILFFILSALFFLIPVALVSAEFSSRYPDEGGIYHWIRHAFGEKMGVLAVWLQWINTMVWYPTMLLFIAGTAAHMIDPALAEKKSFLIPFCLAIFWALTFLNMRGTQISAKLNAFCGIIGTLLPMGALILLGFGWAFWKKTSAISFDLQSFLPSFNLMENGGALVTIMASFLGMELAGVYVTDIENPRKNFPKAVLYSVLILLSTLILGSLAVAVVIPKENIHFVDGIMQTFSLFFEAFHVPFLIPVFAFLIMLGSVGGSVNWLLSPAKGLLQIAENGFLPPYFAEQNSRMVPVRILVMQAVCVSIFCLAIQLIPSLNTFYWFLMALSTGLYMVMYGLLFLAALWLKRPQEEGSYQIPKGMRTLFCFAGLFGSFLTIVVGFQPPPDAPLTSTLLYGSLIGGGFVGLCLPVLLLWRYKKKRSEILA